MVTPGTPPRTDTPTAAPYIGEIRLFGGDYAPPGWVVCDGRELPVGGEYAALFEVIGRAYGGGADTFAVPDLRSPPRGSIPLRGVRFIMAVDGVRPERPDGVGS